jgi:hypothetical protein
MNRRAMALVVAMLFVVSATIVGSAAPVGASDLPAAAVATPEPLLSASCGAPPEGAGATTADCELFVSLWSPRVADTAWLEQFIALDAVPADILAEGFHDLDDATQGWLVASLATQLGITDTQTQAMLSLVIFGKDQLEQLQADFTETTPPAPAEDAGSVLQPLADALASAPTTAETLVPSPPSP